MGVLMDDRELVALCHKGKTENYAVLVEKYQRLVFSIAYQLLRSRPEAEDVAQDAFVKVYQRITVNPDVEFLPFIRTTTSNLCIDRLRRQRTAAKHLAATCEEELTEHTTPESELMHTVEQEILKKAMDRLPEMYRQVLVLYYSGGNSYEAIAELLDQPMSIVKNRIYRAKKILKDLYTQEEGGVGNEVYRATPAI